MVERQPSKLNVVGSNPIFRLRLKSQLQQHCEIIMNSSYDLGYSLRDESHNTVKDVRMNFEKPDKDTLIENINTWLTAIKSGLKVVEDDA